MDLFGDDDKNDDSKRKTITSVGLKENIKKANKSGADGDDEVNLEDPSEDVKDEGMEGKKAGDANASTSTKLAGALGNEQTEETTAEPAAPKKDYSLLDSVCAFLYEESEPLPILCGYFLKVMEQLLDKQKQMILEYLLLH